MANIAASELNALQTRINTERSRRSLPNVTFTDGLLSAGDTIKAVHFTELRNYVESLNTKSSITFNWTGSTAAGTSITAVLPQINTYLTTLENEQLAGWKELPVYTSSKAYSAQDYLNESVYWEIPQAAWGVGNVRINYHTKPGACDTFPAPWGGVGHFFYYLTKATPNGLVSDLTMNDACQTGAGNVLTTMDWKNQNELLTYTQSSHVCVNQKGNQNNCTTESSLYHYNKFGTYTVILNTRVIYNDEPFSSERPYLGLAKRIYSEGGVVDTLDPGHFSQFLTVEAYY